MEMIVNMEEGHMPGQILPVTIVVKRAISRNNTGQKEMVIVVTHPISP